MQEYASSKKTQPRAHVCLWTQKTTTWRRNENNSFIDHSIFSIRAIWYSYMHLEASPRDQWYFRDINGNEWKSRDIYILFGNNIGNVFRPESENSRAHSTFILKSKPSVPIAS